jgi:glutamate-1-semialdehyde aminotransferase
VAVKRTLKDQGGGDDELGLMRIEYEGGQPAAAVVNYPCHPVNLHSSGLITPDYPYFIEQELRRGLGVDLPVLFFLGACGDQNPANFGAERTEGKAAETGGRIARKALELWPRIPLSSPASLVFATRELTVPLQPLPPKEELQKLLEEHRRKSAEARNPSPDDPACCEHWSMAEWAREALEALASGRVKTAASIPCQAFGVGEFGLLGLPGELFTDFGTVIKRADLRRPTFVATLANGCLGYFPPRLAYERKTYEAMVCPRYLGLYLFQPEAGELVCQGSLELLRDLRFLERNRRSRELWGRSCRTIVGGGQAHKRPVRSLYAGGPAFAARARGARFWDVDGNEYLDYLLSYGPIVLGHNDPEVREAVRAQMEEGAIFSVEHPRAVELAEQLCGLIPCAEMALYFLGGSSATLGAIRCARAHTGREKILRCGYHGWFDWCVPDTPGVPKFNRELILPVSYNDLPGLQRALEANAGAVAGVIVEAVRGDGPAPDYFPGVRRLCDKHGAVFILDEVKTGFRFDLGGAQVPFKIDPDLATFGKALCNGYPGAVVVGKRGILEARTDTYLAATFHADLLSVAAAQTVLRVMKERNGIAHFQRLGRQLMDGLNNVFLETRLPCRMLGHPPMPCIAETSRNETANLMPPEFEGRALTQFCCAMVRRGVYVTSHPWFLSLAHTEDDICLTIERGAEAAKEALEILKETCLPGGKESLK